MAAVGCRKFEMGVVVVTAAAVVVMLAVVAGAARPVNTCTTFADEYVYPWRSFCENPAHLHEGYQYMSVVGLGRLEPEWDEGNSTYYVRFTGESSNLGATYIAAVELSHDVRPAGNDVVPLLVNSTVYIYNAESKRALQWREEGTDEYFLIEQEVSSIVEGAPFRFLQARDIVLPCILPWPPRACRAYYLVSDPTTSSYTDAGLLAYTEEGATYIKAAPIGSTGDLPIQLVGPRTANNIMPFPIIRAVTN